MIDHIKGIANSRMVANQQLIHVSVNSKYARLWQSFPKMIIGGIDLRARMGHITTPWTAPLSTEFKMPKLVYIQDRFCDIMDDRAKELVDIARHEDLGIYLMWSGGIDSTAILISLIKTLPSDDLDRLTIVLSSDSILENFEFFRKHVVPRKIRCMSLSDLKINNDFLAGNMLQHGDPGDCIVGPSLGTFKKFVPSGQHQARYIDNIHLIKDYFTSNPEFGDWYVNKLTDNLESLNIDGIDSISDWWWWHYFNHKWGFSTWRPLVHNRTDYKEPLDRTLQSKFAQRVFFNTDRFQLWSYSNLKNHFKDIQKNISSYKWELKNYIFEFDQDREYLYNKPKLISRATDVHRVQIGGHIPPIYYDQDFVGHYLWELGVEEATISLLESYQG